ncbi:MAG: rRNA maturation RNase YbeY [Synergistales bacterium]|nr:rRNA maturation RNase YbeY [Synergistales bacterium]
MNIELDCIEHLDKAELGLEDAGVHLDNIAALYDTIVRKEHPQLLQIPTVEVALVILPPAEVQDINEQYRGFDEPTDVLSFPLWENNGSFSPPLDWAEVPLGDIVLCPAVIRENAAFHQVQLVQESLLVLIHGFLHLLGWDHDTSEREAAMWKVQQRYLDEAGKQLGLTFPHSDREV